MIDDRGLTSRVFWRGHRLPLNEVYDAYREHDVMLFNSLRESGGSQLFEAMATGLPIITLNLHGPGDIVPSSAGFKVDVHTPAQVINDMAAVIDRFGRLSLQTRAEMSEAGLQFTRGMTHALRAERAEEIYRRLLNLPPLTRTPV